MRTRAGWIALVLTGSAALASTAWGQYPTQSPPGANNSFSSALSGAPPAIYRGQSGFNGLDVPDRDDVNVPLPISNRRPEDGGFFSAISFSMYRQPRNLAPEIIARRGIVDDDGSIQAGLAGTFVVFTPGGTPQFVPGPLGVPGTYLGNGSVALMASDLNSQTTYQPGFTYTVGWKFADGLTFEFDWLHLQPAVYSAGASITPPGHANGVGLVNTFLFSPVFNFPNNYAGPALKTSLGNPGAAYGIWNGAEEETERFTQRYEQGDWSLRLQVRNDEISRTYLTAGFRFAWIWEGYEWRTVAEDFAGRSGPTDVAIYNNDVSNRMYGLAFGVEQELYLGTAGRFGAWALSFHGDVAPLLDVVKERAQYSLADRSTANKKVVVQYTFAPEFNGDIKLAWYPIRGVEVKFSWNSLAFLNTVRTYNPVSFDFGNLGKVNDFGPLPPGMPLPNNTQPIWTRKAIDYFDGINVGISLSF